MAYFTALPVPPEVTQALQTIRPALTSATWVHPDDYHLTLKYLGEPVPTVLERFQHTLAGMASAPLEIRPLELHVFENSDLHVLVLLMERTEALHALHRQQEEAAMACGVAPNMFPEFMPHITLASYPAQSVDLSLFTKRSIPAFTADKMTLYKSNKPHGTGVGRYQAVQSYPLKST